VGFRESTEKTQRKQAHKKRPNTIPVFGPGKWLLGESRALKVGINAEKKGDCHSLQCKNRKFSCEILAVFYWKSEHYI